MFKTIFAFARQHLLKIKLSWLLLGTVFWAVALILVWWLGPRIEIYSTKPFESLWGRVMFTLLWLWLMLGVVVWNAWRKMQQFKAERQHGVVLEQDPVKGIIDKQALFLNRWLQVLREHLGKGALYAMPWYLVLGLPGCGKSSLIHRANPANKLNPRLDTELRDVAQDQLIDIWLGEHAVILDPAGELLSQSEPQSGPEQEPLARKHERLWLHLLNWLNESRRRQPLNGLVLTVDLAWLAGASVAERKAYAQLMRSRLQEVSVTMNTRLPLYVVFTKLDMLRGFDVVYGQLDKETRDAVLGVTFNPGDSQHKSWQQDLVLFWDQWVDNLNQSLPELMLSRLDASQRNALFSFVRQLAGLKDYVCSLLLLACLYL